MTVFLEEKESFAVSSAGTLTGMAKNTGEGDNAYGKNKNRRSNILVRAR